MLTWYMETKVMSLPNPKLPEAQGATGLPSQPLQLL